MTMRRLLYLFSVVLVTFSFVVSCASSSDNDTYDVIYEKIQNGDELSQGNYARMIEYVGNATVEAVTMLKNAKPGEYDNPYQVFDIINDKYPFVQVFDEYMAENKELMNDKNRENFKEIKQRVLKALQ